MNLAEQLAPSNIDKMLGEAPHHCKDCGRAISTDEDREQFNINQSCFSCEMLREEHVAGLDGNYQDEE